MLALSNMAGTPSPSSGSTMLGNEYTEYRPSKSGRRVRGRHGISSGGAERNTVCRVRRQSVTEVKVLGGVELGRQHAVQRGGVVVAVVVAYHQQRQQHQRQRTSEYCRTAGLRSWELAPNVQQPRRGSKHANQPAASRRVQSAKPPAVPSAARPARSATAQLISSTH